MPFEKQPFNASPAGAREYLATRRGSLSDMIITEATRVAGVISHWSETATVNRRRGNMDAIRRATAIAKRLLTLLEYAPRIVDAAKLRRDLEFLIAAWESILPRRGRPLDIKTEFSKLMLIWADQAGAGPLSYDEMRAAAIVGDLGILPSDRANRETWRKALDAARDARAADRARFQRLWSARRGAVDERAGHKSEPQPRQKSNGRTQYPRKAR